MRRRPASSVEIRNGMAQFEKTTEEAGASLLEDRGTRQCPVPKPGGILGEMLGFHNKPSDSKLARPTETSPDVRT